MNKNLTNLFMSIVGKLFLLSLCLSIIFILGFVGASFLKASIANPDKINTKTLSENEDKDKNSTPQLDSSVKIAQSNNNKQEPKSNDDTVKNQISEEVMSLGKSSYMLCASCHGQDGKGLKVGTMLMAPSLVGSKLVLESHEGSALVILKGVAKENNDYMGIMAPLGAALNDEKLSAVLNYIRNSWGNSAPFVSIEDVKKSRDKFSSIKAAAGVKRGDIPNLISPQK